MNLPNTKGSPSPSEDELAGHSPGQPAAGRRNRYARHTDDERPHSLGQPAEGRRNRYARHTDGERPQEIGRSLDYNGNSTGSYPGSGVASLYPGCPETPLGYLLNNESGCGCTKSGRGQPSRLGASGHTAHGFHPINNVSVIRAECHEQSSSHSPVINNSRSKTGQQEPFQNPLFSTSGERQQPFLANLEDGAAAEPGSDCEQRPDPTQIHVSAEIRPENSEAANYSPSRAGVKGAISRKKDTFRKRTDTARLSRGVSEKNMIQEHAGYHEAITGQEAEQRLRKHGGNCYLTRFSKAQECYVLSVYNKTATQHFKIVIEDDGQHRIEGKEAAFQNINSLLKYYEQNRIDPGLKSIGLAYTLEEFHWRRWKCSVS